MSYSLKLKVFEGPLDLLCHLIHVNEVDIYDIPITEITNQYMAYLNTLKTFQMDIASEFLLMAATLMEIKSRSLLPANRQSAEEGEETADPREALVAQLLEYQLYQKAANLLKACEGHSQQLYFKPQEDLSAFIQSFGVPEQAPDIEVAGPEALVNTFQDLMRIVRDSEEQKQQKPINLAREVYSIAGQCRQILSALEFKQFLNFRDFFLSLINRQHMIVTFLSLLELMRTGQVEVLKSPDKHGLVIRKVHESTDTKAVG